MRNIWAIMEKELKAYFVSPIAYVVITGFAIISGWFFFNQLAMFNRYLSIYQAFQRPDLMQHLNLNDMVAFPLLSFMTIILIFIVPLITMRLFAEEKKQRTDELLLCSPITVNQIVLGKYLGAVVLYVILLTVTFVYPIILFVYGNPEAGPILSGYLGLLLLGLSFIAVGLFTSSITENQIVAGLVGIVILLMFLFISWAADSVGETLGAVLSYLSLMEHFQDFSKGLIETKHVVYYLSFIFFGLFLTKQSLESLRWR